jgi:hypothetical protein
MRRHLLYGKLPSLEIRIIVQNFADEDGPLKLMQRVSTSMSPFSAFFHQSFGVGLADSKTMFWVEHNNERTLPLTWLILFSS